MRFDLDNLNPPAWFIHPDDSEARLFLRSCPFAVMQDIRKQTTRLRVEYKRNVRHEFEEIDTDKQNQLMWDYMIVDWQGIDNGDEPIPCTTENKIKLLEASPIFLRWFNECVEQLEFDNAERKESAEKN